MCWGLAAGAKRSEKPDDIMAREMAFGGLGGWVVATDSSCLK